MKKLVVFLGIGAVSLMVACGTDEASKELEANDTEKAEAKTEEAQASDSSSSEDSTSEGDKSKKDDIWTYYEDANWSDDFKGLKSEIQKVVVTEEAPTMEDENAKESAVGVKFKMENTTDHKFTTYPDQATLVTSTGEQVEADMFMSDSLGGEIDKGVIKEGNIIWYLERGEAKSIEWIKMEWDARNGSEDELSDDRKDYEVELQLK
ncbi:hypothetical protein [Halobacillus sp. B29]|uniref:hypothetical protein n=1 Tax=Halobacillus sp. B29 TaxID=3457432 RepID=UPI003FCCE4CA